MIAARAWLHIAAVVAPFPAVAVWSSWIAPGPAEGVSRRAVIFGGVGTVAVQRASRLRWPALELRAMAASGGWQTGVGMTAITHLLFGVLFIAGMTLAIGRDKTIGDGRFSDLVIQTFFCDGVAAGGWLGELSGDCISRRHDRGVASQGAGQ